MPTPVRTLRALALASWLPLTLALAVSGDPRAAAPSATDAAVTVVAAGDIACSPTDPLFAGGAGSPGACQQRATSDLALALHPAAGPLPGDLQYEVGALEAFQQSFAPSWGRLLAISHPAVGNHEYA